MAHKPKFDTRSLTDSDGFKWWLEEDIDIWPDRLSAIDREGL